MTGLPVPGNPGAAQLEVVSCEAEEVLLVEAQQAVAMSFAETWVAGLVQEHQHAGWGKVNRSSRQH